MRYGPLLRPQSGVAVPLTALRSREQFGCGEFADLPAFGEWARRAGFDLVQILPVQDSGDDPSPYAARGALALHPIHLRLTELPGARELRAEIETEAAALRGAREVDYAHIAPRKREWVRRIFERNDPAAVWDQVGPWIARNGWVEVHAAYCVLRERHGRRSWRQWPTPDQDAPRRAAELWRERSDELLLHVWTQWQADLQFSAAARAIDAMGLRLKGDLPILCDEDSSDVWYHREYFDLGSRAGAPPDMYAESGQLWGFPCYRWDALAADGHAWWRRRLSVASRYYHALRIDHVLGFFRIWRVGPRARTGMLGFFDPAVPVTRARLRQAGLDDARIDDLAAPVEIDGRACEEADLSSAPPRDEEELARLRPLWDRVLLDVDGAGERFRPYWHWSTTRRHDALADSDRRALHAALAGDAERQEPLWERTGRERLSLLGEATDALVCAEDLGAVPDCVPRVLDALGILGLRVERWCRHWNREGQPFVAPSEFEAGTVCSPGVHDASSLRAWWEEDEASRQAYWSSMGKAGPAPPSMDGGLLREVLERNLAARSRITVLALVDCLALDPDLAPEDPRTERINVPGTRGELNWRWRMPTPIDDLGARRDLLDALREMNGRRRSRPFS